MDVDNVDVTGFLIFMDAVTSFKWKCLYLIQLLKMMWGDRGFTLSLNGCRCLFNRVYLVFVDV